MGWALDYWASQQHPERRFRRSKYCRSRCLAATAFTGFYVGSTLTRWRDRLEPGVRARVEGALINAANWLCANDETHGLLSNHLAAAAASLELAARTFDEPRFSKRATFFLDRILANQSREGWMAEYGGADAGYGGHALFYLAAYWQMTRCARTQDALVRAADFLSYCVHPDGTIGGEYGSRNTEFYYPAGFEMLATVSPASAAIAGAMRTSIRDRRVCGVWSMDEFNLMPMLNNILFALDAAEPALMPAPLPFEDEPFRRYFSDAGLWVVNEPTYYAIVGVSKGGTVSVFDKASRHDRTPLGLVAEHAGRRFTSQDVQLSPLRRSRRRRCLAESHRAVEDAEDERLWLAAVHGVPAVHVDGRPAPIVSRWVEALLVRC